MKRTSGDNLAEALKLLENAARLKRDELKSVMSDKYTHLRSVILENEGSLLSSFLHAKDNALQAASDVEAAGVAKAKEFGQEVDQCVRRNPWLCLAGTALAGLLIGFGLRRGND